MAARRRRLGIAVAAALLAAVAGCSAPGPEPRPGPWDPPRPVAAVDPVVAYADARLASMSLRERIASLVMIHVAGTDPAPLRAALDRTGAAGLIYLGDNVPGSAGELARSSAALARDPGLPPLLAIDQEGGVVRRLPGDDLPAARALRDAPPDAAEAAFAARADLVASAGVSINFGIVADVTADPRSFIRSRVLGADAAAAAPRVAAAVRGEEGRVLSTLKHFPGHGAVAGDSHVSLPETGMPLEEWRATQAPPFAAGIDAGADLVMFGHLRYSSVDAAPTSLSAEWHRILRDELGFGGVVVTDDLTMLQNSGDPAFADPVANGVAALRAGNDLLLYVGAVDVGALADAAVAAVEAGEIDADAITASARRLLELRRELSGRTGPFIECAEVCRALAS